MKRIVKFLSLILSITAALTISGCSGSQENVKRDPQASIIKGRTVLDSFSTESPEATFYLFTDFSITECFFPSKSDANNTFNWNPDEVRSYDWQGRKILTSGHECGWVLDGERVIFSRELALKPAGNFLSGYVGTDGQDFEQYFWNSDLEPVTGEDEPLRTPKILPDGGLSAITGGKKVCVWNADCTLRSETEYESAFAIAALDEKINILVTIDGKLTIVDETGAEKSTFVDEITSDWKLNRGGCGEYEDAGGKYVFFALSCETPDKTDDTLFLKFYPETGETASLLLSSKDVS